LQAATPPGINTIYIRQSEALGWVAWCAAPSGTSRSGDLADLIDAEVPVMKQMVDVAAREGISPSAS
jgi:hypothetical protein